MNSYLSLYICKGIQPQLYKTIKTNMKSINMERACNGKNHTPATTKSRSVVYSVDVVVPRAATKGLSIRNEPETTGLSAEIWNEYVSLIF